MEMGNITPRTRFESTLAAIPFLTSLLTITLPRLPNVTLRHTVPKLMPEGHTIKEIFKFGGDCGEGLTLS